MIVLSFAELEARRGGVEHALRLCVTSALVFIGTFTYARLNLHSRLGQTLFLDRITLFSLLLFYKACSSLKF